MIDIHWHELFGGASMAEVKPVFHIHAAAEKARILERVVADSAAHALEIAHKLFEGVEGLSVSGPHEHVTVTEETVVVGAAAGIASDEGE